LKKFLRHDDATKEKFVLRFLGQQRILQKDLIPILLEYVDNVKISSAVCKLNNCLADLQSGIVRALDVAGG
jgi:replication fork protection complex subunit Tof1/Swi1